MSAKKQSDDKKVDPLAERVAERYAFESFAMSTLRPSDTGVEGVVIWVSACEFGGADSQHGPRIKVSLGTKITPEARQKAVSVRITDPAEFLGDLLGKTKKQVVKFVDDNRDTLLRYWNGDLSTREMLDLIVKRVADRHVLEKVAMIPLAVMSVAKKVSAFLEKHHVPYAIAAGMAVSMHGHPRMTKDVDILVSSSALKVIKKLGKTSPISGHLSGVSVVVDGIDVNFVFLGKGLRPDDIRSADHFAGLPVVGVEPFVLMKLGAGRAQDTADIVQLLKLGKVPVGDVTKRLTNVNDRDDFQQVVEMAELEKAGDNKKARRVFLGMKRPPRVRKRTA